MVSVQLNRIASGFEGLSTNPDTWLRLALIGDIAQAFRQLELEGTGANVRSLDFTTEVMATGAEVSGSVDIAKSFIINQVTADKPCRIRLYSTNQFRIDDAGRPVGTDPVGEHGLLLELVLIPIFLDFSLAPPAIGYNGDNPKTSAIYYSIQNNGVAGPINLTMDYTELVL